MNYKYLYNISDIPSIITPIDAAIRFPEILSICNQKYHNDIQIFKHLVNTSSSSSELLKNIRNPKIHKDTRMSLLKIFRRAVSPVLDTEMSKKIRTVSTEFLISSVGHTFKPIDTLRLQFNHLSQDQESALAALIGEYDSRGKLGYILTEMFFNWFEESYDDCFIIEGPRGAGPDIELSSILSDFNDSYPCDFIIRDKKSKILKAVGFARYDSTRGGAQSDDRTGGNSDKVHKAINYQARTGRSFKIVFLSDGPGLAHRDTWAEACSLDGLWDGNVRVSTLKTAPQRITKEWLNEY